MYVLFSLIVSISRESRSCHFGNDSSIYFCKRRQAPVDGASISAMQLTLHKLLHHRLRHCDATVDGATATLLMFGSSRSGSIILAGMKQAAMPRDCMIRPARGQRAMSNSLVPRPLQYLPASKAMGPG